MGHWNYRVMEFAPERPDELPVRAIHEVYYRDDGQPRAYTVNPAGVSSEGLGNEGLALVLDRMREALARPVLRPSDFPEADDVEGKATNPQI